MLEKEFSNFGRILKIDNFQELCIKEYPSYLDTVIKFKGTEEDISLIYEKYKDSILRMILNSDKQKDEIMTENRRTVRHDKKIEEVINIPELTQNIFEPKGELNPFEERAKNIILLEVAKLINYYGMEELNLNQDKISKEIRLGIFAARTDRYLPESELKKIEQRLEIDESFGEDAIPYVENYELLKKRINSLREFSKVPKEIHQLDKISKQLFEVGTMMYTKDSRMLTLLKKAFADYEKMNREMLLSRINSSNTRVINNPNDESLLLLHFIPDFDNEYDFMQDDFLKEAASEWIEATIETKYGRKYDSKIDSEEAGEMLWDYLCSRKNPIDLKSRIPLKNRYVNDSFRDVITLPHTNLSCSIGKVGDLNPHLDRKIAIGFSRIPRRAIKTINKGYNNALDRFSFDKNSVAISEVLEYIKKGGTNETLVDWTQIEPTYIMLMKDTEELSPELLRKAQEYSNSSGLPLRIYDAYEIKRKKDNPELLYESKAIEGAYSVSDLGLFAQTRTKGNLLQRIRSILKGKHKEVGGMSNDEHSI